MNRPSVRGAGPAWAAIAACAVAAASWPAQARATVRYGEVSVQILPDPDRDDTGHGYVEYRIRVTNDSPSREHVVDLRAPAEPFGRRGDIIARLSRQVRVAPRTAATVSLFQPYLELSGDGLAVAVDGKGQDQPVPMPRVNLASRSRSYGYRSSSDPSPCRVLVSRRVAASPVAVACMSPATATRVAAESGPAEWSTDWLGYSRFDGVLVSDNDVAEMSSQTQNALRQYVECGGALLIAADRLPERFRPEDQPASGIAYLGFGVAVAVLRNDTRVEAQTWSHPWQRPLDADEVDSAFPVTEGTKIPVRGLSVLMILFAILIGPVNLVLLSRWKRRIWMLWIIPAVSLLTCAAVFGYSLFSEGWYAHVRSDVVTVLDESEARATTIGWTGYYAPLTPGDGLRFDATTELSPEGLVDEYYGYRRGDRGSGSARTVDLTSGQHLAAGWVSARVPAVFRVRDSQTRRERLTVRYEADGTPVVGNALGGAIKELYLADASGRIWRAEGLAEAAESRLSSTGLKARGGEGGLRKVYAESWLNQTAAIAREPAGFLRPGCYVAVMENCPFLTAGLAKTQSRRGQAVVYGIMKRDAHGG